MSYDSPDTIRSIFRVIIATDKRKRVTDREREADREGADLSSTH